MVLVLPITSFQNINLAELQLNSPTCPISHNSTHLTASISLDGCGTTTVVTCQIGAFNSIYFYLWSGKLYERKLKSRRHSRNFHQGKAKTVIQDQHWKPPDSAESCLSVFQHTGSELVYVNTLQSVPSSSVVRRKPSLILPLACRIPGAQVKGPLYNLNIPTEKEVFGSVALSINVYFPGEGPFGNFTRAPRLLDARTRVRRDAGSPTQSAESSFKAASRTQMLYLAVMSKCSIEKTEMVVSDCIESETEDFTTYSTIVHQGSVMVASRFLRFYGVNEDRLHS